MQNLRTIEEILSLETGEELRASKLLDDLDSDEIILLRRKIRTANREDKPILVCAECGTKLELSCRKRIDTGGYFYFFKHYRDPKECSIKTSTNIPLSVILARKYANVKESAVHINLKNQLGNIIELFHSPEKISIDEKYYFDKSGNGERRKPDVYAIIDSREFVFEIQLNTTFLSVIEERDSFYLRNSVSVIWIFKYFPLIDDEQRVTQKDIYVPNKLNAFVLDDDMLGLSMKEEKLHFKVYYKTFYVEDYEILSQWNEEIITLDDLNYDEDNKSYYYDSFNDKAQAKFSLQYIEKLEQEERERERKQKRQEEKKLVELNRQRKIKIGRCKELITMLTSEMNNINNEGKLILSNYDEINEQIEDIRSHNQNLIKILNTIKVSLSDIYHHLKDNKTFPYYSHPLGKYNKIYTHIQENFTERIREVEDKKKLIEAELKDIKRRINNIEYLPIKDFGGIIYSVIPIQKEFLNFIEKNLTDIKVIQLKDSTNLFSHNYLKSLSSIFEFERSFNYNDKEKLYLFDFSKLKGEYLLKVENLESKKSWNKDDVGKCFFDLEEILTSLLEEQLSKNNSEIKELNEQTESNNNRIGKILERCLLLEKRIENIFNLKNELLELVEGYNHFYLIDDRS